MKDLFLKDILSAVDTDLHPVEVPEWGGTVYVGVMTLSERLAFDEAHRDSTGALKNMNEPSIVYDLLKYSLRDKDGNRLLDDSSAALLGKKSSKVITSLFAKAINVNYLTEESVTEIKKK